MLKEKFNDNWVVCHPLSLVSMAEGKGSLPEKLVHLPHDHMILSERSEKAPGGFGLGYYMTEDMNYAKEFDVPEECKDKKVWIEFEGAFSNCVVFINNNYIGKHPFGYSNFIFDLTRYVKYGAKNKLKVLIKNGTGLNSRWYSGAGLYRNVNLYVTGHTYIPLDGVKISTPSIDPDIAQVLVNTQVTCEDRGYEELRVKTEIYDANDLLINCEKTPVTIESGQSLNIRQKIFVDRPKLWSLDEPVLYYCRTKLMQGEQVLDEARQHFGVRKIQFDTKYGFRLNGEAVKLRGGCFHHDNGVIGACAFDRAEERKVELFKAAGFNAMRSAHNPASRALLDACDRIGMLMIDESFDVWNVAKVDHDYSLFFEEWWEKELKALVDKDYNHPSVICYSVGNEIPEQNGASDGAAWASRLADHVRGIDSSRPVLNAICGVGPRELGIEDMIKMLIKKLEKTSDESTKDKSSNEGVNSTEVSPYFDLTEEYASANDVVGYNYLHSRWELDLKEHPNRLICGTESMAMQIADVWRLVKKYPAVLGDFTWTGMDYIGETGCGKIDYSQKQSMSLFGEWPWILAYCGDIDLIGTRRPQSYYREIVWGLRKDPYIAVSRPERHGQIPKVTAWSWTDVIESWSFPGYEGTPVKVEVYADGDEVELRRNGETIGRLPAGDTVKFKAVFETTYEPGELTAISYRNNKETGRMKLKTAGAPAGIEMVPDRTEIKAGAEDLCYIAIKFVDSEGNFVPYMNEKIKITVNGAGSLQGCGSGDPTTDENYYDNVTTTYDGRALAVVRSDEETGEIEVVAESDSFEPVRVILTAD